MGRKKRREAHDTFSSHVLDYERMDTPLLTTAAYHSMQAWQLADEEVFAALHSPHAALTATGCYMGIARLHDKTVWALYTQATTGQTLVVGCGAHYLKVISGE